MLNIREINSINQFFELRQKWNDILDRSKDNNVYLTWEYLSTYWKHFGKGKRLRILCIEERSGTVGIVPLRQSRYRLVGGLGYDVVEPLGYRGLTPEGADYTGIILVSKEEECLRSFLSYLVEQDDWDFIYLMDIPETSLRPGLLARISKDLSLAYELERGVACPYMPVPSSMDVFLNGLDGRFRKNLRRCMRNLKEEHHKVELKKYHELGSVEEAMRIFFELHQRRWKLKNMPGVFDSQRVRDFYTEVAELFADNGWLALYFLTADDEPVAAQYCFDYGQKMYYALGGFDPDYFKYSVGNILFVKVAEKCIEKGIREYDLLKGGEPYKFKFTAKYRRNLGIRLVNRRVTSNLYHLGMRTLKRTRIDKVLGMMLT